MAMMKNYKLYHKTQSPQYSVLLDCRSREDALLLESGVVAHLTPNEVDIVRSNGYAKVLDAYGCMGIYMHFLPPTSLDKGRDRVLFLVLVTGCVSVGKLKDFEVYRITNVTFFSLRNNNNDKEIVSELVKLLSSGLFYFGRYANGDNYDLTLCEQRRHQNPLGSDTRFFWNFNLCHFFRRYDVSMDWVLKIICGGIEVRTIYAGNQQARVCLFSRLSCERAGTRFNVRGVNDEGHVANFVETEQVIYLDEGSVASYIHVRGSVPLFWEQTGLQVGSHKIKMVRTPDTSVYAYDRHLSLIRFLYGNVAIVNLLGSKEGEMLLSHHFYNHHIHSKHKTAVPFIAFDYHSEMSRDPKNNRLRLLQRLERLVEETGIFHFDGQKTLSQQTGILRTNCVDCLDRTNAVQTMVGIEFIIKRQLELLGLNSKKGQVERFTENFHQIWQLNGDHVSRIYAGTGAMGGGRSKFKDASRSATRTIQNNFLDQSKQDAMDALLLFSFSICDERRYTAMQLLPKSCLYLPAVVLNEMINEYNAYCNREDNIQIFVGTWNVNGGKHFRSVAYKHESVSDWLLDLPQLTQKSPSKNIHLDGDFGRPIDIYAIGFEEMVDLNASNIVSTRSTNQKEWCTYLQKTLSRNCHYTLVSSVQLVGVCLYIFIRTPLIPFIKDVATCSVKTGLHGTAGNKGGVAIRFDLFNTSMCFVCSHFAAGQNNVRERNDDFIEISRRMHFPQGRNLYCHDYVFWCGDFNYRIDLSTEEVKRCVSEENWSAMQQHDQLVKARADNAAFVGFMEGYLNFAPTYKYDLFCNDYDTSEKARVPAWTDRILWRRMQFSNKEGCAFNPGKLMLYNRAELKTSDHRPVAAFLAVQSLRVDQAKRASVFAEVIQKFGPSDATVIVTIGSDESLEIDDPTLDLIIDVASQLGQVLLVRIVNNSIWLTFSNCGEAVYALSNFRMPDDFHGAYTVHPKHENWYERLCSEWHPGRLILAKLGTPLVPRSIDTVAAVVDAILNDQNASREAVDENCFMLLYPLLQSHTINKLIEEISDGPVLNANSELGENESQTPAEEIDAALQDDDDVEEDNVSDAEDVEVPELYLDMEDEAAADAEIRRVMMPNMEDSESHRSSPFDPVEGGVSAGLAPPPRRPPPPSSNVDRSRVKSASPRPGRPAPPMVKSSISPNPPSTAQLVSSLLGDLSKKPVPLQPPRRPPPPARGNAPVLPSSEEKLSQKLLSNFLCQGGNNSTSLDLDVGGSLPPPLVPTRIDSAAPPPPPPRQAFSPPAEEDVPPPIPTRLSPPK